VWVDVVPHRTKIPITQIPAKTLARRDLNGRGISDIGSTIQAETGGAAAGRKNNVIEVAAVGGSPQSLGRGVCRAHGIGTDALLELCMLRRFSIADIIITHFSFLVLGGLQPVA
jgi:hypothetical protein